MDYKYHKIVFDLIRKKVTWAEIKSARKIDDIITRLKKLKKVTIAEISLLKYENVCAAVDIYNKYTTKDKIHFIEWTTPLVAIFKTIKTIYEASGPNLSYLSNFVPGIGSNKVMAATIYKFAESFLKSAKEKGIK